MKIHFKLYKEEVYGDLVYFKKKSELAYEALLSGHLVVDKMNRVISPFSIKNKKRYFI